MLSLRRSEDAVSGHMTQKIRMELFVVSTERFDWKNVHASHLFIRSLARGGR